MHFSAIWSACEFFFKNLRPLLKFGDFGETILYFKVNQNLLKIYMFFDCCYIKQKHITILITIKDES